MPRLLLRALYSIIVGGFVPPDLEPCVIISWRQNCGEEPATPSLVKHGKQALGGGFKASRARRLPFASEASCPPHCTPPAPERLRVQRRPSPGGAAAAELLHSFNYANQIRILLGGSRGITTPNHSSQWIMGYCRTTSSAFCSVLCWFGV